MAKVLITGGLGFIGSHVVEYFVQRGHDVIIADRLTYAGKLRNIAAVLSDVQLLIGDLSHGVFAQRCAEVRPDWVVHMAAETHVDLAILDPERFMQSNALGTLRLLQAFTAEVPPAKILVYSTDEVFGPTPPGMVFDEQASFKPSNAYSASKVAVEGIVSAFRVTHQLPLMIVRPCNTYSIRQHPEKVIPKFIRQMLSGEPVTLYNDGRGSRDWLHVTDHARAVEKLLLHGIPGESYNLGANDEHSDQDICERLVGILGSEGFLSHAPQVTHVPGRPGHDRRYAMDTRKLRKLEWYPEKPFSEGLTETVLWNATHQGYWANDLVSMRA